MYSFYEMEEVKAYRKVVTVRPFCRTLQMRKYWMYFYEVDINNSKLERCQKNFIFVSPD